MTELKEVKQSLDNVFDYLNKQELGEVGKEAINDLENALSKVENLILHDVSQQREQLPIWLSSEAYICAKEVDFKEFHEWWCKQPNG